MIAGGATRAQRHAALLVAALATGCGGKGEVCAVRGANVLLAQNDAPPLAAPPPEPSRIGIAITIENKALAARLDRGVPRTLAAESRRPVGAAGRLTYRIDRDGFGVAARGADLLVQTRVHAALEVCKPLGILGCPRYASCQPDANATLAVSTKLDPHYRWARPKLTVDLTKPCRVTALNIDVSPMVEARVRAQTGAVEDSAARALPDLHRIATRAWASIQKPLATPSGCVALHPESVAQGPLKASKGAVTVPLVLTARPRVTPRCPEEPRTPLPPLSQDPRASEGFDVTLQLLTSDEDMTHAVDMALARGLDTDRGHISLTRVRAHAVRGGLRIDALAEGAVCGHLAFVATLEGDRDGTGLRAAKLQAEPGVPEEAASVVGPALAEGLHIALPTSPDRAKRALDGLDVALDDATRLETEVKSATVAAVYAVAGGIDVRIAVRGTARILVH